MVDFEESDAFKAVKIRFDLIKPFLTEIFTQYIIIGTVKVNDEFPSVPIMFMSGNLYDCYNACHRTLHLLSSLNPPSQFIPDELEKMVSRCFPSLTSCCHNMIIIGVADSSTSIYIVPNPKDSDRFSICSSLLWILQKILSSIPSKR